ncbi:toxin-antitoxin system, toxin component, Txe/YoeB family [Cruoricaptor ignavus]|uniref:Putative mRNA interferase YoeB n=1 Tax=Cruoricaptor ignavus TaxID=1118202 RepID=A0A1M6H4S1_9FLAO|nr:Txe/YoeB family addiction module toxin [Cruoricaptor ignavus]SHJ17122.1 toxin-antitoxin system, toxin component, Txe/YoeB family [Cruoricaptor ignavus]
MGQYFIEYSKRAAKDLKSLSTSSSPAIKKKIENLLEELENHPRKGIGSPERLKYYNGEIYSRTINKKDRLVYEILESEKVIIVVQFLGHYDDK